MMLALKMITFIISTYTNKPSLISRKHHVLVNKWPVSQLRLASQQLGCSHSLFLVSDEQELALSPFPMSPNPRRMKRFKYVIPDNAVNVHEKTKSTSNYV